MCKSRPANNCEYNFAISIDWKSPSSRWEWASVSLHIFDQKLYMKVFWRAGFAMIPVSPDCRSVQISQALPTTLSA